MSQDNLPILVTLDGSKNAENAVPVAARLARAYGVGLLFVHVADAAEGVRTPADLETARGQFETYALNLGGKHAAGGAAQSAVLLRGSPARAILDYAANARMVVIASHGRGGARAAMIGSVADKVVRGAVGPVLLVPALGEPAVIEGKLVLVALDGSELSERGLAAARDLAARLGSKVALVRSYVALPPTGVEFAYYSPELLEGMEEGVKAYLAKTAKPGEQTFTVQGSAAQAIVAVAQESGAGLVVMTSHGRGFAARLAMGSTTGRVMHSAERPLLVVPAGG